MIPDVIFFAVFVLALSITISATIVCFTDEFDIKSLIPFYIATISLCSWFFMWATTPYPIKLLDEKVAQIKTVEEDGIKRSFVFNLENNLETLDAVYDPTKYEFKITKTKTQPLYWIFPVHSIETKIELVRKDEE